MAMLVGKCFSFAFKQHCVVNWLAYICQSVTALYWYKTANKNVYYASCLIAKTTFPFSSHAYSLVCHNFWIAFKVLFFPKEKSSFFLSFGVFFLCVSALCVVYKCVDFLVTSVSECHVKFYSGVKSDLKEDILLCYFWLKCQLYYILLPAIESSKQMLVDSTVCSLYLRTYREQTEKKREKKNKNERHLTVYLLKGLCTVRRYKKLNFFLWIFFLNKIFYGINMIQKWMRTY